MDAKTNQPPILPSRADSVLTLTLNRPEARNALSEGVMQALQLSLDEAAEDAQVRVIILAAKGPAFCAGHDLKELTAHRADADRGLAYYRALFAQCSHLMQTIVRHPKPVIAQVHAVATAAGCQLVATCDLAVASTEARFATPGVNIGLFCSTPMVALSRNVPRKHAMEMLLTGEAIDAARAAELGLVNRVVAPNRLESETTDVRTPRRVEAGAHDQDRQGRVLSAAGDGLFGGLRLCERGDDAEHAGRRRRRRHWRVPGKAPTQMA